MEPEKINIAIYWPGKVQVESRGGGGWQFTLAACLSLRPVRNI